MGKFYDFVTNLIGTLGTAADARSALGAAALGANVDINTLGALASINGHGIAGLYNRLINPAFAHDQRNAGASTATADDTYCFDRWYALTQTGTVAASQLSDPENGYTKALRLTQSQASAQRFGVAQIIEGKYCKDMRGGAATLVPRIRCSSSQALRYAILEWNSTEDAVTSDVVLDWTSASYTAGGFFLASNLTISAVGTVTPTAATWTNLTKISPTLGSAFNNLIVMIWTEGTAAQNVTLDFDYAQLESGSIATTPERRASLELALCQRYYTANANFSFASHATTIDSCETNVPFKVAMRAAPTVTFTSNGGTTNFSSKTVRYQSVDGFSLFLVPTVNGIVGIGMSGTPAAWNAVVEL